MKLNIVKSLNLKHSMNNTISIINQLGMENICVIVPDKLSATMEQFIFEKLNIDCSFNISVNTLNRLSKNILAETNATYKPITKIGGIILLKKLLNENRDLITSFKSSKHSYKYSNEIYKTLAQLKACQLTSEELTNYKNSATQLQQKINDLGNILQLYNEAKADMLDNSDTLTLTCMMLDKSNMVKNTNFIFVGFDDFTSQGYFLIVRLIKLSKSIYVNTYFSTNYNKNIYYQDVFYRLLSMCQTIGANDNIIELPFIDDNLHLYLTKNLFAFNKLGFNTNPDTIRMYQAQNIVDELEFVARDIRKKVLDGARYREFGIAVYNLDNYAETIKQVFNKYELCTYLDIQKSFASTCVYKFFTNLWELYVNNYETLNLIELINSPFIILPEIHKAHIIKTIKKLNYRGNLSKLDCKNDEINMSIKYIYEFLTEFSLTKSSTIEQVIDFHNNIIEKLNMQDIVTDLISKLDDAYDQKILTQAIKHSNQLLNEISQFYPNSTFEEVLDIYSNAGNEMAISPLPLSADCIQVVDACEILSSFDNLYFVNCNSSTAPCVLQDVGILIDRELSAVELSHNIEPSIARMNRLNRFKLFNSSLMFDKTLTISMSLSSPSETSPIVSELKSRIFVSDSKNDQTNIDFIYPYQTKEIKSYIPLSLWDLIEYVYTNNIQVDDSISKLIEDANILTLQNKIVVSPDLIKFNEISASALETYFQCPIRYFFNNLLRLKEPTDSDIQMMDIGNIMHNIAYIYYRRKDRTTLEINQFCNQTINYLIQQDEKLKQHINNPILINLIAESKRFITHLRKMDENGLFVPTYFEKAFGSNHAFKALPLTDEVGLKGKVDRIDFYNDYFRIIDYKSGNADPTLVELYYGKKLQLFLYALAIQNATSKQISGTFYLPIKNIVEKSSNPESAYKLVGFHTNDMDLLCAYDVNIIKNSKSDYINTFLNKDGTLSKSGNKALSPSEMERLMEYSKNISALALKDIKCGIFKASPLKWESKKNACSYCPYLALCSKESNNNTYREVGKVTLDSFIGGSDD